MILLDSIEIMVYDNHTAEAWLGVKNGGVIAKKHLLDIGGVRVLLQTREDHSGPIVVNSYTVIAHKSDGAVLYVINIGNKFNEKAIQLLQDLVSGEKLTFTNIQVSYDKTRPLYVKPIEFAIE